MAAQFVRWYDEGCCCDSRDQHSCRTAICVLFEQLSLAGDCASEDGDAVTDLVARPAGIVVVLYMVP